MTLAAGIALAGFVLNLLAVVWAAAKMAAGQQHLAELVREHRDESRKRGEEHTAELKAVRHDLAETTRAQSVTETRAEATDRRVETLEREVEKLRGTSHDHGRQIQGLLAKGAA